MTKWGSIIADPVATTYGKDAPRPALPFADKAQIAIVATAASPCESAVVSSDQLDDRQGAAQSWSRLLHGHRNRW
jgi:hypothetical protein